MGRRRRERERERQSRGEERRERTSETVQSRRDGIDGVEKRGGDCCFERARDDEHILVFLHADTTMPETYRDDIFDALRKERRERTREALSERVGGD